MYTPTGRLKKNPKVKDILLANKNKINPKDIPLESRFPTAELYSSKPISELVDVERKNIAEHKKICEDTLQDVNKNIRDLEHIAGHVDHQDQQRLQKVSDQYRRFKANLEQIIVDLQKLLQNLSIIEATSELQISCALKYTRERARTDPEYEANRIPDAETFIPPELHN